MKDSTVEMPPIEKAIGDFLGIVQCLLWVNDVGSFRRWMKVQHAMELMVSHLAGYKLLFDTLLRMLISDIEHNISLGLSSDEIFDRASFRGKSVFKLPNTCEKTIVIKNIVKFTDDIFNSTNWEHLSDSMVRFSDQVLRELVKIRDVSILNTKFQVDDIETAIKYSSAFQVYIYLNDTSRGLPHGYTSTVLEDIEQTFKSRSRLARNYGDLGVGYKYGVQYLWFQLLGDKFSNSVVRDLHTASNWDLFDKYFDKIQKEIISPIEESTAGRVGFDYFILVGTNPKLCLQKLLETPPLENKLTQKELLQQIFLWYPMQFINCYEYDFAGVPTLIPLLMGMIQRNRRASNEKSKVKVIRIIHGEDSDHRRNYSYAVLIELFGYISNASGWMLFYDCCSDRGSTSGLFADVESLLNRYFESEFIEIKSVRIEQNKFIELIKDDLIESDPFAEK